MHWVRSSPMSTISVMRLELVILYTPLSTQCLGMVTGKHGDARSSIYCYTEAKGSDVEFISRLYSG